MGDLDFDVHLHRMRTMSDPDAPLGFVINAAFDADEAKALLAQGLVPVAVGSHAQIPHFLLSICRAAARGVPLAKASGPPRPPSRGVLRSDER